MNALVGEAGADYRDRAPGSRAGEGTRRTPLNTIRALVIDENDTRRGMIAETLAAAGYEVETAEDGPDGLRIFRDRPPTVVVLDLEMPETDGLETLRRLRLLDPFAAFVGLTDLFLEDADRLGVAVALSPGCRGDALVRAVEDAVERTLAEAAD